MAVSLGVLVLAACLFAAIAFGLLAGVLLVVYAVRVHQLTPIGTKPYVASTPSAAQNAAMPEALRRVWIKYVQWLHRFFWALAAGTVAGPGAYALAGKPLPLPMSAATATSFTHMPNPAFQVTANQRPAVRWLVPSALRAAAAPELLRWAYCILR